jgi:hypothetical protein
VRGGEGLFTLLPDWLISRLYAGSLLAVLLIAVIVLLAIGYFFFRGIQHLISRPYWNLCYM